MNDITPVRLIVGLGNPGNEYSQTRHNAGFWLVDEVLRRFSAGATLTEETKFHGHTGQILIGSQMCRLLLPNTFMNRSGLSVASLANFYKIEPEAILVAHDELDIAPGTVRLKVGGGHGGHNGLRDTIKALDTNNFYRLRIGIGHPGTKDDVVDFVLSSPGISELKHIESSMNNAIEVVDSLANGDFEDAMLRLHTE